MNRRLTLSSDDRKIAGVCGGIAEYFGFDATLVRVAFVILTFILRAWPMIILYIICWAVMPRDL